jgi:TIR domain
MKVFVSWSGERSRQFAHALHEFLPLVIQQLEPFMSESDIMPGTRWAEKLSLELDQTNFGVICLTSDNLKSEWLHFEAGALSKKMRQSFICTCLLDLTPSDVLFPLAQFQHTTTDKESLFRLLKAANTALPNNRLDDTRLRKAFEKFYDDLLKKIDVIPKVAAETSEAEGRTANTAISLPTVELAITFEKEQNYTVHPGGFAEAKVWVRNSSTAAKAVNVCVVMESLRPTKDKKLAQPYSHQFNNVKLKMNRYGQGCTLEADSHVEVQIAQAENGASMLIVPSSEKEGPFQTPFTNYVATIRATADNAATVRREFVISARRGTMVFKELSAAGVRRNFVGRWFMEKEDNEPSYTMTLYESGDARKTNEPAAKGRWGVEDGEAHVVWDDDWRDILRPQARGTMRKLAYFQGSGWTGPETNKQWATRIPVDIPREP